MAMFTLWVVSACKILHQLIFFLPYSFNENLGKIQLPVQHSDPLAIQLLISPRDGSEHILPNRFGIQDRGLEVITKYRAEASSFDVFLCNIGKPLRMRLFLAPTVAEEESVAVPQLLKLLLDDAGKEGSHLFTPRDDAKNLQTKKIKTSPFHRLEQFRQDQR